MRSSVPSDNRNQSEVQNNRVLNDLDLGIHSVEIEVVDDLILGLHDLLDDFLFRISGALIVLIVMNILASLGELS